MRIDLGFSLIGDRDGQVDKRYVSITRKDVLKRVNEHPALDQWVKDHLTKKINEYPDHALVFFVKNIDKIVRTALEERSRTLLKENNDQKDLDEASSEIKDVWVHMLLIACVLGLFHAFGAGFGCLSLRLSSALISRARWPLQLEAFERKCLTTLAPESCPYESVSSISPLIASRYGLAA